MTDKNTIIIGIGHEFRGDDGLGPLIIDKLNGKVSQNISLKKLRGDISTLISIFNDYKNVIIVDAMVTHTAPIGYIHRVQGNDISTLGESCRTSTHGFSIPDALNLAETLQCLPQQLTIFGIESNNFNEGAELSPAVSSQVEPLITKIINFLE